jgi:acyl carrier protein
MSQLTPADVRTFLKGYLEEKYSANGHGQFEELRDDCDLLDSGIIDDSIGFLDLLLAIQEFAGQEIDFDSLDSEAMSIVGPLCRFVSEQTTKDNVSRAESFDSLAQN